ncbi:hypothetical protein Sliba_11200 [Streptomyces nigrescens]|uniref:Uncharacterized protein n=1 Tax=Streptomyces nigrescens TaxID=1920 RepID=A0A640TAA2_STRNI|nr:hypothetical protein Sliba_11200 [Streptomyces libani subsp. libani]GGV87747.1 hypothetical protein GCM10010500_08610 [Streptomyces libani subsp. libani]
MRHGARSGREALLEEQEGAFQIVDIGPAVHHTRAYPHDGSLSQGVLDEIGGVPSYARLHQGHDMEVRALRAGSPAAAVHEPQLREAEHLDIELRLGSRCVAQLPDPGKLTAFHKKLAPFDRDSAASRL